MKVETVVVVGSGGKPLRINKDDFVEGKHKRYDAAKLKAEAAAAERAAAEKLKADASSTKR